MGTPADSTLRTVRFRPYALGKGPTFVLTTWDTGRMDRRGCTVIGYRLNMLQGTGRSAVRTTIFDSEDFAASPMHADDSDETIRALMGFLTLRPGDTDADYFASDTELQWQFREEHAEALAMEVERRFGEER